MKRISALFLLLLAGCWDAPVGDKEAVKNPAVIQIKYVAGTNDGMRIYETDTHTIVIWRNSVAVTRR